MAQGFPRFCPRCGAATVPSQRLCPRCGLDLVPWLPQQAPQPSSQPGYQPSQPGFQPQARPTSEPGIQPPPEPLPGQPFQQYDRQASQPGFQQAPQPGYQLSQPGFQQAPQPGFQQASQPGFDATWGQPAPGQQPFAQSAYAGYTAPPSAPVQASRSSRGKLRLVIILLLVLIVLGGAGYLALHYLAVANNTQPVITASSINATVTYAGVTMSILKVEQSQRFLDDPNSATDGMVRVHLQAQNKTTVPMNLLYNTIATLALPGGKVLTPTYVKGNIGVAPGATQTSIVDFAVPADTKVNQLVLNLGATDEAQVAVPLTPGANLTQYAPKTTNLTGTFQYLGLNWSLVNATTQLSIDGKQASKGMHYVTVTLNVNNTLAQTAISGSPYDYIRLKAGNTTAIPVDTTLPVSFAAGATGKTGTVTFLVPQDAAKLTLIMLAQPQSGFDQVTEDFQLA
jgi:hypothetical protein